MRARPTGINGVLSQIAAGRELARSCAAILLSLQAFPAAEPGRSKTARA